MKRPTITDLAEAAGVSVSTVNRLLGGQKNVRNATMQRVQSAAEEIGFYGLGAIEYRVREAAPIYRLGFLLQQSTRPLYQLINREIVKACHRRRDEIIEPIVEFVDELTPENFAYHLKALATKCDAVSLIAPDHPVISQAISEVAAMEKPVVAYITDQSAPERAAFVGTDNWKLGRTAAYLITKMVNNSGRIAVFIGSHRYQCQDVSDASFRSYIRENAPQFTVEDSRPTDENPEQAYKMVKQLLATTDDLIGILIFGGGISGVVRALREIPEKRRKKILLICRDSGPETLQDLSAGIVTATLIHPLAPMSDLLVKTMIDVIKQDSNEFTIQRTIPFEIITPESL
ncbi:MAG: substrate-binding domain-containing protein [Gammaproteobacteria bacterium]|nr:substrate-binding domain-containing protein [Gammaproteobacteria bacterium]